MTESISAYPLHWPQGWQRRPSREASRFQTTLPAALKNVESSLRLFGKDSGRKLENIVMSSNVTLGAHRPADPGVAVWFTWDGTQVCIPVDRYTTVEANLQAIHHIIEARRVELRHGTLQLVHASFAGFKALPAPKGKHWREVLGVTTAASRADVISAHKRLAQSTHPDQGGNDAKMAEINAARDMALREIGP